MRATPAAARRVPPALAALLGAATFLLLHLLFRVAWQRFFARVPWPGYEESLRRGMVEPWFVHTPRSLWLTRSVFFLLALALALSAGRARWPAATALWAGAGMAVIFTWAMTTTRTMEYGWLGFAFYPFRLFLPILLGTALGELLRRTLFASRHS